MALGVTWLRLADTLVELPERDSTACDVCATDSTPGKARSRAAWRFCSDSWRSWLPRSMFWIWT
ncbi:hypothetical protein D3C72_2055350 [compost metagenome]